MARKVDVTIGVKNKTAAGLKAAGAGIKRFSRNVSRSMRSMGLSFRRVATVGAASFIALIKYGNAFRASMAEVKTMLGDDKTMLPELTRQVRELSGEFGLAKKTLADGLYQALSAGIPAGNAIEFLTVASKAAVGGVTDVKTAVDGLTSTMNAYGIEASKAAQVSDIMFTIVKEGKINYEELSQNIGTIAPFAKTAGVGLEDLSAMIATLVKVDKPERAMTSLGQAMAFAAGEGKPLMQVLNEFEGKSLEDLLAAGVSKKAAKGIAIISGNMEVLRKEMKIFQDTAGAGAAAFEDVDAVRGWQKIWQQVLAITSQVGEQLDSRLQPSIKKISSAIKDMFDADAINGFVNSVMKAGKTFVGFARAVKDNKVKVYVAAITAAVVALSVKVLILASKFKLLTTAMNASTISAGFKALSIKLMGNAAAIATPKILALRVAMIALKGVGVGLVAVGFMAITKAALDAKEATRQLLGSMNDLSDTDASSKEKFGLKSPKALKMVRKAIESGDEVEIERMRKIAPKAVAAGLAGKAKRIAAGNATPAELIGLGKGGPKVNASSISANTSMMSTSDLFTMMQTGGAAKKEAELTELQGINTRLDEVIKLSGGAK